MRVTSIKVTQKPPLVYHTQKGIRRFFEIERTVCEKNIQWKLICKKLCDELLMCKHSEDVGTEIRRIVITKEGPDEDV